ncbi:hypothetical protein BKA70DRAFT_1275490 [Coprinopsis sp. MPI-PUGE-AT-0042]|nr:hypothetical protein BKA70DRAFT_1275490 [Coprinopsis sp. MPI-PUGE-AT-0042]
MLPKFLVAVLLPRRTWLTPMSRMQRRMRREVGRENYGASYAMAPTMLSTGGGEAKLPQVQMVQQAVSMDQTYRLVMQGLSRHAKVGPGGKLTPKGVWAKADGGVSEGAAMEVDGSAEK